MVPITSVPAVTSANSADETVKVPPVAATEIDLAPFGSNDTVPDPALTEPEKVTLLAVILIAELVVEIDVEPAFVTLPVPSAVMVIAPVPVAVDALALRFIEPLDPDDVCSTRAFADNALLAVMLPLPVNVNVPVVDVMAPDVVMLAEAPVVVTEKLPPTVDVLMFRAPVLLMSAVAEPPVFALRSPAAVRIGVPDAPMLPLVEVKFTVLAVSVTLPERVIAPEPLALTLIMPEEPALTLALRVIAALAALVVREIMPLLEIVIAVGILKVLPDVIDMLPVVLTMLP